MDGAAHLARGEREGVIVGDGEEWHFQAYEGVVQRNGDVFGIGVRAKLDDEVGCDKRGDGDALPKREEENALQA